MVQDGDHLKFTRDAEFSSPSAAATVVHGGSANGLLAWKNSVALVENGDLIELDVPNRRLSFRVPDEELARRRAQWKPRAPHFTRGYGRLFLDHVLQAHEGCDFDFLRGKTPVRIEDTAGPSHS